MSKSDKNKLTKLTELTELVNKLAETVVLQCEIALDIMVICSNIVDIADIVDNADNGNGDNKI